MGSGCKRVGGDGVIGEGAVSGEVDEEDNGLGDGESVGSIGPGDTRI